MSTTNLYRALMELLPESPLQVATVVSVNAVQGTSTITWPGGDLQTVRGTSLGAGIRVFVRNGVIEGSAPNLTLVTIEV
jgi:hypothetical protein